MSTDHVCFAFVLPATTVIPLSHIHLVAYISALPNSIRTNTPPIFFYCYTTMLIPSMAPGTQQILNKWLVNVRIWLFPTQMHSPEIELSCIVVIRHGKPSSPVSGSKQLTKISEHQEGGNTGQSFEVRKSQLVKAERKNSTIPIPFVSLFRFQ